MVGVLIYSDSNYHGSAKSYYTIKKVEVANCPLPGDEPKE